jgi:membrane protein
VETYEFEPDYLNASHSFKRIAALLITHLCVNEFLRTQKSLTAEDISHELEMPIRLVRSVLFELTEGKILAEVYTSDRENIGHQPGCYVDDLTVSTVLERLDQRGIDTLPIAELPSLHKFRETIRQFYEMNAKSPADLKLKEA